VIQNDSLHITDRCSWTQRRGGQQPRAVDRCSDQQIWMRPAGNEKCDANKLSRSPDVSVADRPAIVCKSGRLHVSHKFSRSVDDYPAIGPVKSKRCAITLFWYCFKPIEYIIFVSNATKPDWLVDLAMELIQRKRVVQPPALL
jgi:hypothetical protein